MGLQWHRNVLVMTGNLRPMLECCLVCHIESSRTALKCRKHCEAHLARGGDGKHGGEEGEGFGRCGVHRVCVIP